MQINQNLSIIVELTKLIREKSHDSLDIFEQISSIATEITQSDRSSLYLYDDVKNVLRTRVAQGTDKTIEVKLNEGLAGLCAQNMTTIIENDVQNNEHFAASFDKKTGFVTKSTICVPVFSQSKKLLAVVQVLNKQSGDFNSDDRDLLLIISELIASVIEDFNFTNALKEEVALKTQELRELNTSLENRVKEEVALNREKDQVLFAQSKLASMGEMFDAVAHQWRQPLSVMSIYSLELQFLADDNNRKDIEDFSENLSNQINHLNSTLTEFRSFFRPDKEAQVFSIEKTLAVVINLIQPELRKYSIEVDIHIDKPSDVFGMANEFKHVLLNLLNNEKDAFIHNDVKNRKISLDYSSKDKCIKIEDNAGGIDKSIIAKIFDANFTSHSEDGGTGMGLYMSKLILDKIDASIKVDSKDNQTCFTINFVK